MKAKQFVKKLKSHGVQIIKGRGKGGHCLARFRGKQATIPIHGHADLGPVFLKKLCKQLGLDYEKMKGAH